MEDNYFPMLYWFLLNNSVNQLCACMLSYFSRVQLFVTPWTVVCQAPVSMGFSKLEYWSGLPCSAPGNPPNPGSTPGLPHFRQTLYHLSHQRSLFILLVCPKLSSFSYIADDVNFKVFSSSPIFFIFVYFGLYFMLHSFLKWYFILHGYQTRSSKKGLDTVSGYACEWRSFFTGWLDK